MSDKDLTRLSQKQLESMLAKKYGVDKYLNQRSQLLELMNIKGETDIDSGFTGPETEALSIIFEKNPVIGSRSKAEGGIVNLLQGSDDDAEDDAQDYSDGSGSQDTGNTEDSYSGDYTGSDFSGGGFDEADDTDESRAGDYQTTQGGVDNKSTVYSGLRGPDIMKQIESNPQLQGFLGDKMKGLIKEGNISSLEKDDKGRLTGMNSESDFLPGTIGIIAGLMGLDKGSVYTGYGQGYQDMFNQDDGGDSSEMIKKIVKEKEEKKKDSPLSQEQIDYYTRGMGTATKSLKTLEDINSHMSSLVGPTESSTGAKLSKDKKFLILANGKIINTMTGRVQDSMSGLELFRGGLV